MKIPQFQTWIGTEEYEALAPCFEEGWITEGPRAKAFSEQLLALMDVPYGVFAPNGTLAIYLALRAIEIGPGDEVIVPDFTFLGSASAVQMTGARPVFVDVNRDNFQIDLTDAARLVTPRTKAIMPVHIYGTMADMGAVLAFAARHNLLVIEDAAQAVGLYSEGTHAGTFGAVGTFSFFADKTITTGEGGFIVTRDKNVYENLLYLRNQGRIERGSFIHPRMGYNFRMTDLQCAMGIVQLAKFPEIVRRKEHIRALYEQELQGVPQIQFFKPSPDANFIPFRIGVLCDDGAKVMAFMKDRGIEGRSFFYPLHRQPCFEYLKDGQFGMDDADFPNAVYGYEHGICLPTYPTLKDEEVRYVCAALREYYAR